MVLTFQFSSTVALAHNTKLNAVSMAFNGCYKLLKNRFMKKIKIENLFFFLYICFYFKKICYIYQQL